MNKSEFKQIFDSYFDSLRSYIYYRITDEEQASDMTQELFMRLWEKRERLNNENIKALLYKMASDMVVSHYRKHSVRLDYARNMRMDGENPSPQEQAEFEELKVRYAEVLTGMKEQQRQTFLMSREESLKYHEIAERLSISVKAVEKRMTTALQILREKLL